MTAKFAVIFCFSCSSCLYSVVRAKRLQCDYNGGSIKLFNSPYVPLWFPEFSGADWVDYEQSTANINSDEIKRMCELLKELFQDELSEQTGNSESCNDIIKALYDGSTTLADCTMTGPDGAGEIIRQLLNKGEKPILFAWRNINGKINANSIDCVAVRNNSENKENAYQFIKILMSYEVQKWNSFNTLSVPISNKVVYELMGGKEEKNSVACK